MAVAESRRGQGKFEVLIKTQELAMYTVRICSNPKTFDPMYQTALTNRIIDTATAIHVKAKTANEIRVNDDWYKAVKRKRLQEDAIADCNTLLALIDIAKRVFHLSSKRVKYWGKQTINARDMLRRWKDTDSKRYAHLKPA